MKYVYCEIPVLGAPVEKEMSKKDAVDRYNCKIRALEKHGGLYASMWFVGVQIRSDDNASRRWLMKN